MERLTVIIIDMNITKQNLNIHTISVKIPMTFLKETE